MNGGKGTSRKKYDLTAVRETVKLLQAVTKDDRGEDELSTRVVRVKLLVRVAACLPTCFYFPSFHIPLVA
jgi:hypothetical protein